MTQLTIDQTIKSLDSAFEDLQRQILVIKVPEPEEIEGVSALLNTGVSHRQIAQMFGDRDEGRGVGPFFDPFGNVDIGAIERENQTPGSIIDLKSWKHPRYLASLKKYNEARFAIRDRLAQLTATANALLADLADAPATVAA